MKKLSYKITGEFTDELLTLRYGSDIIYKGYTDDLITSVTGDLELHINFGMARSYLVVARRFGNYIVWIPKLPLVPHYRYKTIIFTLQQFVELWSFLKYEPTDDLETIKNITTAELKLVWMILARGTEQINDIQGLVKSVRQSIIALSTSLEQQEPILYDLIEQDWSFSFNEFEIIENTNDIEGFIAYLDKGIYDEWEVFRTGNQNDFYIHLGAGFSLPI